MTDWHNDSQLIDQLRPEIGFLLQNDFYSGDPNNPEQFNDEDRRQLLDPPNIPRQRPMLIQTHEVEGYEIELGNYYQAILQRIELAGKEPGAYRPYFWLSFSLSNEAEQLYVSLPWFDDMRDIDNLISDCMDVKEDSIVDLEEQGLIIKLDLDAEYVYLLEYDSEQEDALVNVKLHRKDFDQALIQLKSRMDRLLDQLTKQLGADHWHLAETP